MLRSRVLKLRRRNVFSRAQKAQFFIFFGKKVKRGKEPQDPSGSYHIRKTRAHFLPCSRSLLTPPLSLARSSSSQRCFWLSLCAEKVGRHINFSLDSA